MRPAKYMPENTAKSTRSLKISSKLKIVDFLRAHWTALMFAFCAVLGETLTDVLEPWPVKIVVADLLQNKRLPGWSGRGHCHGGRSKFVSGKTSYNQREPVGNARFATDTVQPQELHPLTATVKESRSESDD